MHESSFCDTVKEIGSLSFTSLLYCSTKTWFYVKMKKNLKIQITISSQR